MLNLRLYKMKKHELKDYQKTIQDVLANSEDDPAPGDQGQNRAEAMSTPSPAGSDGSRVRNLKKIPKFDFCLLILRYIPNYQLLIWFVISVE